MAAPEEKIIPAYPFVQYNDDENVVAFFSAYNIDAQKYLSAFNKLSLAYWPSTIITGYLLDWVSEGIYGESRPVWQTSKGSVAKGTYDTTEYNTIPYAKLRSYAPGTTEHLPDDYFKRVLTWNFYKGDGMQFTVPWFKRRIARFIHGENGIDPGIDNTFDVSIKSKSGTFYIEIPDYGNGVGYFLKTAIEQEMVKLPFIYSYSVSVVKAISAEVLLSESGDQFITENGDVLVTEGGISP